MTRSAVVVAATVLTLAGVGGPAGQGRAQIQLDGSTCGGCAPLARDADGTWAIEAGFGQRSGVNLLHSFARFDLPVDDTAEFRGPATGVSRILARVTGAGASRIDGLLRSTIPAADLYFFNPAGVVFGPDARLDVGGSFHVATAMQLEFADESALSVDTAPTVLSSAAPSAWGFVGAESTIEVDGATLAVRGDRDLSLAGLGATAPGLTIDDANLLAPGGHLSAVSAGGPGRVSFAPDGLDTGAMDALGDVVIGRGTLLDVSADGPGRVTLRGRDLDLHGAAVFADNLGASDGDPLGIDMRARRHLVVSDAGGTLSLITAEVRDGAGSAMRFEAERMTVSNAFIGSTVLAERSGAGGAIDVEGGALVVRSGAQIVSTTQGTATGRGGDIRVRVGELRLEGAGDADPRDTLIASVAARDGTGVATGGDLHVDSDSVHLLGGAQLRVTTEGGGDAGDVIVETGLFRAAGAVLLDPDGDGAGPVRRPGISTSAGSRNRTGIRGRGGDVRVLARRIELDDGAAIALNSFAEGPAGLELAPAGTADLEADSIFIGGGELRPGILSIGTRDAPGGRMHLRTGDLELRDGGRLSGATVGRGDSGRIEVVAGRIRIAGAGPAGDPAGVFARSRGSGADAGDGGDISIATASLQVRGGGGIGADAAGPGHAGNIDINSDPGLPAPAAWATGAEIALEGDASILTSVSGEGPAGPRGGSIRMRGRVLSARDGATISAENSARGDAGRLSLEFSHALDLRGARIATAAADGAGGEIRIRAGDRLLLVDSAIETSVSRGAQSGGDIDIDPRVVVLNRSRILARAADGRGGNIRIVAGQFVQSADSAIDATSQRGLDGRVEIAAGDAIIPRPQRPLHAQFFDASDLIADICDTRSEASGTLEVAAEPRPPAP